MRSHIRRKVRKSRGLFALHGILAINDAQKKAWVLYKDRVFKTDYTSARYHRDRGLPEVVGYTASDAQMRHYRLPIPELEEIGP